MSYEILYNKQFIKLSNGNYIPLICTGSNNCWNGNKRERHWWNIARKQSVCEQNKDEILLNAFTSSYEELFMYKGKWIKNHSWKRHLERSIKDAMTFEEFREYGNVLEIYGCCWLNETHNDKYLETKRFNIRNESEFYSIVKIIKTELDNLNDIDSNGWFYNFTINYDDEKIYKPIKPRKLSNKEPLKEFYYILINGMGGFVRKTKYGYKYDPSCSDLNIKKFKTERLAKKYIQENLYTIKNIEIKFISN